MKKFKTANHIGFLAMLCVSSMGTTVYGQNSSCKEVEATDILAHFNKTKTPDNVMEEMSLVDAYRYLHSKRPRFQKNQEVIAEILKAEITKYDPRFAVEGGKRGSIGVMELPFMKLANDEATVEEFGADIIRNRYYEMLGAFCDLSKCCKDLKRLSYKQYAVKIDKNYVRNSFKPYRQKFSKTLLTAVADSLGEEGGFAKGLSKFLYELSDGKYRDRFLIPNLGIGTSLNKASLASGLERRFNQIQYQGKERRNPQPMSLNHDFGLYNAIFAPLLKLKNNEIKFLKEIDDRKDYRDPAKLKNQEKQSVGYLNPKGTSIGKGAYHVVRKQREHLDKKYPIQAPKLLNIYQTLSQLEIPFFPLANKKEVPALAVELMKEGVFENLENNKVSRTQKRDIRQLFQEEPTFSRVKFYGDLYYELAGKNQEAISSVIFLNADIRNAGNDKPDFYKVWMEHDNVFEAKTSEELTKEILKYRKDHIKEQFKFEPLHKIVCKAENAQKENDRLFFNKVHTVRDQINKSCENLGSCTSYMFATGDDIIAALVFRGKFYEQDLSLYSKTIYDELKALKQRLNSRNKIDIRLAANYISGVKVTSAPPYAQKKIFERINAMKRHNEKTIKYIAKPSEKNPCKIIMTNEIKKFRVQVAENIIFTWYDPDSHKVTDFTRSVFVDKCR